MLLYGTRSPPRLPEELPVAEEAAEPQTDELPLEFASAETKPEPSVADAPVAEEDVEEPETPRTRGEKREAAHRALDRVLDLVEAVGTPERLAVDEDEG